MPRKPKSAKAAGAKGFEPASRQEAHAAAAAIMGDRPASGMDRESRPVGLLVWSKRSMGYGPRQLDRGQVFALDGLANDRLLVDLGYVGTLDPDARRFRCRACDAEFVDEVTRDQHGRDRHEAKRDFQAPSPPMREVNESEAIYQNRLDEWAKTVGAAADHQAERRADLEDEIAPLDLTKSSASRS